MKHICTGLVVIPVVMLAAVLAWLWQAGKDYAAWPCRYGQED
jgi:hypothetical protein